MVCIYWYGDCVYNLSDNTMGSLISKFEYDANGNATYVGLSNTFCRDEDALWLIQKMTYDSNDNVLTISYAEGSNEYNKSWSSRANYTYTPTVETLMSNR